MVRFFSAIALAAVMILTGCRGSQTGFWTGRVRDIPPKREYRDLVLEKLTLDSVCCSGDGKSGVFAGRRIYYLDPYSGSMYLFDADGRFGSKRLGTGRGPMETTIRRFAGHAVSKEGELALFGSNVDFEWFDSTSHVKKRFVLPFDPDNAKEDRFETYSYAWDNLVCRMQGHILYIGMYGARPSFNYLDQTDAFLRNGYHIGRIDLDAQKPMPMFLKGFPRIYHDAPNRYMSAGYVDFDIDDKGIFHVGFEADSLIYTYDSNGKPLTAFGRAGRGMDLDYRPVYSWKDRDKHRANRKDKGRYSWIEYVDATGYLFRSYCRGEKSATDGLQIYRDGILIGDVDVPKNFRVSGYIAPFYYSQIFEDEESEIGTVYRFRL